MAEQEKVTVNDVIDAVAGFFNSIGQGVSSLLRSIGETDISAIWSGLVIVFFVGAFGVMVVGVGVMFVNDIRGLVRRWTRRP